jgi:hypothetical protein
VNEKKIEIFINYQPSIKDKLPLEIVKLAEKTALQLSQGDRETILLIRAEL